MNIELKENTVFRCSHFFKTDSFLGFFDKTGLIIVCSVFFGFLYKIRLNINVKEYRLVVYSALYVKK